MTNALREQAGLSVRTGNGQVSGDTTLAWTGPTRGGLQYLIYGRAAQGEGAAWTLLGAVTRTAFTHKGAGVGVPRHYRVVPQRGERQGARSYEATVYA